MKEHENKQLQPKASENESTLSHDNVTDPADETRPEPAKTTESNDSIPSDGHLPSDDEKKKRKKKAFFLFIAIVAAIVIVAVGVSSMRGHQDDPAQETAQTEEKIISQISGLQSTITVVKGTKSVDYLKDLKYDEDVIQSITVDDSQVNLAKAGTYEIIYHIDLKDPKAEDIDYTAQIQVTDPNAPKTDKEDAKKDDDKDDQPASNTSSSGSSNSSSSQKPSTSTSKPSGSSSNSKPSTSTSKPSSGSSSSSSNQTSSNKHTHSWQPVYTTIHHDAVYEKEWIVTSPAWDEPIYESHAFCNVCGKDLTAANESPTLHAKQHALAGEGGGHNTQPVQVGTTHHEEEGYYENQLVQDAYDETVIDHYKCSCGATK